MKKTLLITLLATAIAVAPAPLTYAQADDLPTATTQETVYGSTYEPATPAPAPKTTVQNAAYKRGDVAALKLQIAKLLVNPKDTAAKAEILKLAPTKKYIPVVARAISELKAEAVKELTAAGSDKALQQKANLKIRTLNQISKEIKQAIINNEKKLNQKASKAKKAIAPVKNTSSKTPGAKAGKAKK